MKPLFKPKKDITKVQKDLIKTHSKHHTKKHIDLMIKFMKQGFCFQQAHQKANKLVGR